MVLQLERGTRARKPRVSGPRSAGPKVTTGCVVCKIRHVRCDEEKPFCLRCTSTGRKCEGYMAKEDGRRKSKNRNGSKFPQQHPSSIIRSVSGDIAGCEPERRGFHFFRSRTAKAFTQSLASDSWMRIILQASHVDDTVRLAAAALGTLNERFQINSVLTVDNAQANLYQQLALVHYEKVLRQLSKRLVSDGQYVVEFTLITCFLLVTFEFLQGNDQASLIHLRNGLAILYQYLARPVGDTNQAVRLPGFREEVVQIFGVLDTIASMWLGTSTFPSTLVAQNRICNSGNPIVLSIVYQPCLNPFEIEIFQSLDDAETAVGRNINQMLQFGRYASNHEDPLLLGTFPPFIQTEHRNLIRRTSQWPSAMERLLLDLGPSIRDEDLHRVAVCTVNHKMTSLRLAAALKLDNSTFYRLFTPVFSEILEISRPLLYPINVMVNSNVTHTSRPLDPSVHPMPIFSFTRGIIQPLYFTAIKCQESWIRRQAVSLLATKPWREGAWDSAAMAKIVERKVKDIGNMDGASSSMLYITTRSGSRTEVSDDISPQTDSSSASFFKQALS